MSVIDERIVSMVFDNSRFQQNAQNTMDSLDALDESINEYASNTSKSFLDLSDGLSRMDVIFAGFYEKIGGYLADLTMKGVAFSKSLSIDQVTAGFSKYTAETLAVQTIVSNTNNTLDHTYEILGDILDYTDKTSYHYDSMTNTMAKFANQGVELDQAALAVKGIANWAAISGAGIEKADITMNALIKSMASGNMQMREWRTISQVANMGTAQFKDTLIQTAQAMAKEGKASKDWLKITAENFESENGVFGNNKLITSDVMLEVLKKYGDETSELGKKALAAASEAKTFGEAIGAVKDAVSTGFGTSFRYLFGNYDEARKFWTMIQDMMLEVFTLGIEFRNNILKTWHDLGGYQDMVKGIADAWEAVKNAVKPIGDIIKDVFNIKPAEEYAEKLQGITKSFRDWADRAKKITSINTDEYKNVIKELTFLPRKVGKQGTAVHSIIGDAAYVSTLRDEMETFQDRAWDFYGTFRDILELFKTGKDNVVSFVKNFTPAFEGIGKVAKNVYLAASDIIYFVTQISKAAKEVDFFGRIAKSIASIIHSLLTPVFTVVNTILGKVGGKFREAGNDGDTLRNILDKVASAFEKLSDFLTKKAIGPAVQFISDAFKSLGDRLSPIGDKLKKVKDAITGFFAGSGGEEGEEKVSLLSRVFTTLGKAIEFLWDILSRIGKKVIETLGDLLGALTGGGGLGSLLAGGGLAALGIAIKRIAEAFDTGGQLYNFLYSLERLNTTKALKEFATALLILAAALFVVASIDTDKLMASFAVLSGLVLELSGILDQMTGINLNPMQARSIKQLGVALIEISASVLILALALKSIASIESDKLLGAVIALEVLLASITGVALLLGKYGKELPKGALALIEIGVAVRVLASSVKALAGLSWEELAKGLLGTIALLGAVTGAAILLKETGLSAGTGLAIVEIAVALKLLTGVVDTFGKMDWEVLGKGLLAVVAALAGIGLAMNTFPTSGMVAAGAGLVLVAAGLTIIAKVLNKLALMSIGDLAKSIGAMTVSLAALGIAMNIMTGTLGGAAAMLIMSAALIVFVEALKLLIEIDLGTLAAYLGVLAGALLAFGAITVIFSAFTPAMIAFAAAIALLGVGVLALGAGLAALSGAGAAAIATLSLLIKTIADLLPYLLQKAAEGLVAILGVFASSGQAIMETVTTLLLAILEAIIQVIPKAVETVTTVLIALLDALIALIPKVIEVGVTLILALLDAIKKLVPEMIDTGVTIVVSIIEGIAKMVVAIVQAGIDMIAAILNGIADAIRNPENKQKMRDAGKNILSAIFEGFVGWLANIWKDIKEKGGEFLRGFKEGLDEKIQIVKEFFTDLPGKVKQWILDKWHDITEAGGNIVKGIKQGISDWWNNLGIVKWFKGKIGGLTSGAKEVLDEHSPSRVFAEIGRYIDEGLILGIENYSDKVNKASENLGKDAIDSMRDAVGDISDVVTGDFEEPVIRPVVDLSEVEKGASSIDSMLSNNYSLGLSASAGLDRTAGQNSDIYSPTINMTINGAQGQDVTELADIVANRINQTLRSRERVWA